MITLTQQQMDDLQAKISSGNIGGFYSDLESYGDTFGTLGLAVTNNSGWQGKLANLFAASGASDEAIDLSYNSTAWTQLNEDIAARYLTAYEDNIGGQPTRSQIQDAHNDAYVAANIDANDWLPNKLLNESSDPDALWSDFMANEGGADMWDDAFVVAKAGAGLAFPPYFTVEALTDPDFVADIGFARHFFDALGEMSNSDRTSMALDVAGIPDLVNMLNGLPDVVNGLLDDIGDALDNPGLALDKILPDWTPDFLTPWDGSKLQGSPLIVDLDGDGVEATTFNAATTTTFFDLDNDGFAEQTAWVGAHDGLLVRDVNVNGTIDNASELFGSTTVDGFALLALLDSNGDLQINANDVAWNELKIWKDANGDAISQQNELNTLAHHNITSIDLAGVSSSLSTVNGNPVSHTSTVTMNGSSAAIADVWFVHDHMNTAYQGDYTLDVRALFLPTLRGFGQLTDLHVAMSQDQSLLSLVQDFVTDYSVGDFADLDALNGDIEGILFKWAGVDGIATNSRGDAIDARRLEFMEEMAGENWTQSFALTETNPFEFAAEILETAWSSVSTILKMQLVSQTFGASLFEDNPYSVFTGDFNVSLALSQSGIDALVAPSTAMGVDTEQFWVNVARFLDDAKGFGAFTTQEDTWMNNAIQAADATLTWTAVKDLVDPTPSTSTVNGTSGNDTLSDPVNDSNDTLSGFGGDDVITASVGHDTVYGGNGIDTIYGGVGDDTLHGDAGNDTIDGGDGHDLIYGGNDNDIITGGQGNDRIEAGAGNDSLDGGAGGNTLLGGDGNDTYIYSGGNDVYTEIYSGTDVIEMPTGVVSTDLSFERLGENSLLITVAGYGTIQLNDQINTTSKFETILFSDASTLNLLTYSGDLATHGTSGNDNLNGVTAGAGANDTIYGYGGNDNIQAQGGNNIVDGGAGNDSITFSTGNDTIIASAGYDTVSPGGGTDTLEIPVGYDIDDVEFIRVGAYKMVVSIDGLGQVDVANQFFGNGNDLDYIDFASGGAPIALSSISITSVGTDANDSLSGITVGASTNDMMYGRAGNDSLWGQAGNDTLDGGAGDDTLYGYNGDDVYYFSEGTDFALENNANDSDTIRFRSGTDPQSISFVRDMALSSFYGSNLSMVVDDGLGNNLIFYYQFADMGGGVFGYAAETVEFEGGPTWAMSTVQVETRGTASGDYIYGLTGGASLDDIIFGNGGNDAVWAGDGDDDIYGGVGADYLDGGAATDTVNYSLDAAAVTASLTTNSATDGNSDIDTFANIENLVGSDYGDTLTGSSGGNEIRGGDGADTIRGAAGDDTLYGDAGNDSLYGDGGIDTLYGGGGADTFVFESATVFAGDDVLKDFSTGDGDAIDIADVIDYDPMTDVITDFVQITDNGVDSFLAVDWDGGANNFVQVAAIEGVTGLTDEAALVTSGNLIAA